jgi:septal ring factor EnvC (AmiA/AmiB activator)
MRADGTTLPTQMKITALTGDEGKISGFMVFALDNSECRRLEEKLNQTLKQAEALRRQIQQLQSQIAEREQVAEGLKQQIDSLSTASEQLQHDIADYEPDEQKYSDDGAPPEGFDWKGGPFDADELKAIADLAKKLG